MKNLCSIIPLLLISTSLFATTIDQKILDRVALDIDNICGDTYCEGDFNWAHDNLRCDLDKGVCSLDMELIEQFYTEDLDLSDEQDVQRLNSWMKYEKIMLSTYSDIYSDTDENYSRNLHYTKTCTISNLFNVSDIVSSRGSYAEKLMDGVFECVSEMEMEFWKRAAPHDSLLGY